MSQSTATVRSTARHAARRLAPAPLRVVPSAIRRTRSGVFAGVCLLLLVGGLLALLILSTALAQGTFQVDELQQRSGRLADTQVALTETLDEQRTPLALAARAQQLGMVPASSMAFLQLSDGQIIGVAEPAPGNEALTVITTPVAPPEPPPEPATDPAAPAADQAAAAATADPAAVASPAATPTTNPDPTAATPR